MNPFINLYHHSQTGQAKADSAKDAAQQLRWEVEDLKRKADALTIACQALWEILRHQAGLSDEAILETMQEIDLRDGKVDGKITRGVSKCPECGRANNTTRKLCLYCGTQLPPGNVFEKV